MGAEFAGGIEATRFAFTHDCWWGVSFVARKKQVDNELDKDDVSVKNLGSLPTDV